MGNENQSAKYGEYLASHQVTWQLALIQPVCIIMFVFPHRKNKEKVLFQFQQLV